MNTLKMDEAAWRLGYVAGATGKPSGSNPYPLNDERGLAWASGFIEGQAAPDRLPQMRPIRQEP